MKYKIIIFDIDGTVTKHISSWQYIHEELGIWNKQAERYQEEFLAGKISYQKFCELDAADWKGMPEEKMRAIFQNSPYALNAVRYIGELKKMGFKLVAISTGLQYMAERIKEELQFDYVISNQLMVEDGLLTGKLRINITHGAKGDTLKEILLKFKAKQEEVIGVGDSAGDISLARGSGYSIAFNSSDEEFSRIVDYNCRTKDFKEVFDRIVAVSK